MWGKGRRTHVVEVDGPAMSGIGMNGNQTKYETHALGCEDPWLLEKVMREHIGDIHGALHKLGGGTLFWRKRPEMTLDPDTGVYTWYARLLTRPDYREAGLKPGFVEREGDQAQMLPEASNAE